MDKIVQGDINLINEQLQKIKQSIKEILLRLNRLEDIAK